MLFGILRQIVFKIAARNLIPIKPVCIQIDGVLGVFIFPPGPVRTSHQKLPGGNQHHIRRLFSLGRIRERSCGPWQENDKQYE
jgi:hypothetical protein